MQCDRLDDDLDRILSARTYKELRRWIVDSGCTRCPLHEGRTRIVPDRGQPNSDLVLIGEGPGAEEDRRGLAFVGRAGQILDRILAAIELDTDRDCLILNVVKCRPPGNRAPTRNEAETCSVYLEKQLELVKPRIVALLGATALRHLDPSRKKVSMAEEAGRFFRLTRWPDTEFVVLYHPAALLYDPRLRPRMEEHVQRLRRRLDGLRGVTSPSRRS